MKNNFSILFFLSVLLILKSSFAHEINEKKINKIIKKFLIDNPSLIEKSLKNYEQQRIKKEFHNALFQLKKIPNPVLSGKKNGIIIYEFFDYNCGYCKTVMNGLFNVFNNDKNISIVFVEFPILSESSLNASIAALAAHKQNKYREFHINLMQYKGRITQKVLLNIAKNIKINIGQFKKDVSNSELMSMVNNNRKIAKKLNLQGTPAFIIGNSIYPGAMSEKDIIKAIKFEREKLIK